MPEKQKRIPIAAGEKIATDYGYDQVVIIARKVGDGGGEHVTTYGRDKQHCDVAARMGDFLKHQVMRWPGGREMSDAPRDGTHILAYLYMAPDDEDYPGFGEWREIFYKPGNGGVTGWSMPWRAGDPFDSHSGDPPECMGENVPIAWLPLPARPASAKLRGAR